ncbi:cholesterol 7-desaturase-like protein [Dinothrombium tinctorium]|uniref:Cholesterol 7-desaturase-like protein n=1 Tax=Dinothrombium tinctorium TaxID=1965070 RepID=A0A3S3Q371_9ACAR|nr:cholesterol 7-desaturase-like protein [Dinothrombium tinctorium]RWS14742.1 cholesterol 7-desaturase-like protein [Dinothrombium tinctorium]
MCLVGKDIPENGADVAHLKELHPPAIHEFINTWNPSPPPEIHKASMQMQVVTYFFKIPIITMNMNVEQIGPALVHLYVKSFAGIEGVITQHVVPVKPFEQKVIHRVYFNRGILGKLFAKFVVIGESIMFERDIRIWREKKYLSNPRLVKEDSAIAKFRKWFKQFYSDNSVTTTNIDW